MPFQACEINANSPTAIFTFVPDNQAFTWVDNDGDTIALTVFWQAYKTTIGVEVVILAVDQFPVWLSGSIINEVLVGGIRSGDVQVVINNTLATADVEAREPSETTEYVKIGITIDDGTNVVTDFFWFLTI